MSTSDLRSDGPALSRLWCAYFAANREAPDELPWHDPYVLTAVERRTIAHSIRQFQLGEAAEGRRLQMRGRVYSDSAGDAAFPNALLLFIKEEQRHSGQLLRFMRMHGIPPVGKHWLDGVFRRVRVMAGLELELRVLVTAEVIAVPYYRALAGATRSELLGAISRRILRDEAGHLRFQASMLSRLQRGRLGLLRRAVWYAHRAFLLGTCCVVWAEHRPVFSAAGYSFVRFVREALEQFASLQSAASLQAALGPEFSAPPNSDYSRSEHRATPPVTWSEVHISLQR